MFICCKCFFFVCKSLNNKKMNDFLKTLLLLTLQDFLGQAYCTLGEVVGSLGSRSEKPLGWVGLPIAVSIFQWLSEPMLIDHHSKWNLSGLSGMLCVGLFYTCSCFTILKTVLCIDDDFFFYKNSLPLVPEKLSLREMSLPQDHPLNSQYSLHKLVELSTGALLKEGWKVG